MSLFNQFRHLLRDDFTIVVSKEDQQRINKYLHEQLNILGVKSDTEQKFTTVLLPFGPTITIKTHD